MKKKFVYRIEKLLNLTKKLILVLNTTENILSNGNSKKKKKQSD